MAGGFTGQAYVYDTRTGATVATYQFGAAGTALDQRRGPHQDGAWFTDSIQPKLYFVPVSEAGVPGPFRTLALTGPAADISGDFNLNGIQATANGKTLIVAHSANGELYTVDPATGASATIAGVSVPNVDGIVLQGKRLWAVQNFNNQVGKSPAKPGPQLRCGRGGHHQRPVPGADHCGPLWQSTGGGQREVRHRLSAHRRPVRGRPG